MVLAGCVVVHLGGVIYAVRGGLTAAEILGRTRGNGALALFYGIFVIACAIHAPIGIANVVAELTSVRGWKYVLIAQSFALLILGMGFRAAYGVFVG